LGKIGRGRIGRILNASCNISVQQTVRCVLSSSLSPPVRLSTTNVSAVAGHNLIIFRVVKRSSFRSLSTEALSEEAELGHTGTLYYQAF
jgi:hypothetical protein